MFKEGLYKKLYYSIVARARNRLREEGIYYENHHIIPSSLGGTDDMENIVALTAREHFICHYLLTKITVEYDHKQKMIWAYYMMCVDPVPGSDERKRSARYELARKLFVDNHPTKQVEVVEKIRQSVLEYYASDRYVQKRKETAKYTDCKCGCGLQIAYYGKDIPSFLNLDHYRTYQRSDNKPPVLIETRQKQSTIATNRIANMTPEQRKERMLKSAHSCDHIARGEKISLGKKGKKTNQQEIAGRRYANMSDEEFKSFLYSKKRPDNIIMRMIKLRDKYVTNNRD
jgi:hypothetical protein